MDISKISFVPSQLILNERDHEKFSYLNVSQAQGVLPNLLLNNKFQFKG